MEQKGATKKRATRKSTRKIRDFCKVVSEACEKGMLTAQQGKTLVGQAKSGDYDAAMKGLKTIADRL